MQRLRAVGGEGDGEGLAQQLWRTVGAGVRRATRQVGAPRQHLHLSATRNTPSATHSAFTCQQYATPRQQHTALSNVSNTQHPVSNTQQHISNNTTPRQQQHNTPSATHNTTQVTAQHPVSNTTPRQQHKALSPVSNTQHPVSNTQHHVSNTTPRQQ